MGWALRTMNKGQMLFNRCIQRDSGRHTDTHTHMRVRTQVENLQNAHLWRVVAHCKNARHGFQRGLAPKPTLLFDFMRP